MIEAVSMIVALDSTLRGHELVIMGCVCAGAAGLAAPTARRSEWPAVAALLVVAWICCANPIWAAAWGIGAAWAVTRTLHDPA